MHGFPPETRRPNQSVSNNKPKMKPERSQTGTPNGVLRHLAHDTDPQETEE